VALARTGHASQAREAVQGSQALARDREARYSTLAAIEKVAVRDSVQALLDAGQPAAALALVDRFIATFPEGKERSELLSARAEITVGAAQYAAIEEYNAGVEATRQDRPAEARVHFVAAQKQAVNDDLRGAAAQAIARLDSVLADGHAADAFERGVRAWKAGDYRAARSRFDSTQALAMSPGLRASAAEAASNAGAHVELERGIAAAKKGVWADAIAAFQRAVALAKAPDLKDQAEKLLAQARQASGTPTGHK
jgi:tetratricopeptide (TPR) repeat protein